LQRCGESCRIARRTNNRLVGGFVVGPVKEGLDGGANRSITRNLAQRTDGAESGNGMQVSLPGVGNPASLRIFFVVVKGFRGKKLKLCSHQHAHDKGVQPDLEPGFLSASHFLLFFPRRAEPPLYQTPAATVQRL
jgi:hypothetical protein